jgi:hypothetical protein
LSLVGRGRKEEITRHVPTHVAAPALHVYHYHRKEILARQAISHATLVEAAGHYYCTARICPSAYPVHGAAGRVSLLRQVL